MVSGESSALLLQMAAFWLWAPRVGREPESTGVSPSSTGPQPCRPRAPPSWPHSQGFSTWIWGDTVQSTAGWFHCLPETAKAGWQPCSLRPQARPVGRPVQSRPSAPGWEHTSGFQAHALRGSLTCHLAGTGPEEASEDPTPVPAWPAGQEAFASPLPRSFPPGQLTPSLPELRLAFK